MSAQRSAKVTLFFYGKNYKFSKLGDGEIYGLLTKILIPVMKKKKKEYAVEANGVIPCRIPTPHCLEPSTIKLE